MPDSITLHGAFLAAQILAAGVLLSFGVRWAVRRLLLWRRRGPSSARVFSRVAQWVVITLAFMAAITVVFPSVRPVDVLGGITIVSIAAGIAFQTVLGSMFAGFVLLARDRFRVGDQIGVGDVRGEVVAIGLTSTVVRGFDGRLVVLPNTVLHGDVVTVQTGYEQVRSSVVVSLDETTDLDRAREVAVAAMDRLPRVLAEPRPQALLQAVGAATVDLELRFWSGARQLETVEARNDVISAVLTAFREQGVVTGSDAVVIEPGPVLRTLLRPDHPAPDHPAPDGDA